LHLGGSAQCWDRRRRPHTCARDHVSARNLGDVPARDLKGLADAIAKQQGSGVVALVSTAEGKASIVVAVSPDLTGRTSAVDLVRAASAAVGGKGGGGRPDLAQAGGPGGTKADEALAETS
jgi:alanyl-tRNA synthetase